MDSKNESRNSESSGGRVIETDGGYGRELDVGQWATFLAALAVVLGAVMSIKQLVVNEADLSMIDGGGLTYAWGTLTMSRIALASAVIVGVFFAWRLRADDGSTMSAAGISTLIATLVLILVIAVIRGIESDASLDLVGVVGLAAIAAIAAAVIAVGSAWVTRNLAPDGAIGR